MRDRPIVRAFVDDFHEHGTDTPHGRRWHMDISGTGPLPSEVLLAIAGGPVLISFERGSGGAVVEAGQKSWADLFREDGREDIAHALDVGREIRERRPELA